jgi:hypothetical protein
MQRYLETRSAQNALTAADLARHLLPRQHLGKIVVVCDKPVIMMSVTRKYWLKLSRTLQRERSSTLNAEKILQLTHDITHMQHMGFIAKPFYENPEGDVFFITPAQLEQLPPQCFSLYIVEPPDDASLRDTIAQLPDKALVIDYTHSNAILNAPLAPKRLLDKLVPQAWQKVEQFFEQRDIRIDHLVEHMHRAEAIDEVIDVILNTSTQFLRTAEDFLEILYLAQPLQNDNSTQRLYDLVALLHRRVYALTPGNLSQQFAQSFGDDEPIAHDIASEKLMLALAM